MHAKNFGQENSRTFYNSLRLTMPEGTQTTILHYFLSGGRFTIKAGNW